MWRYGVEGDGVWCGGVVWRLEGEKYKKYAHWDVVFQKTLVNFLLSVPAFMFPTSMHNI